jgi:hypothetical protein
MGQGEKISGKEQTLLLKVQYQGIHIFWFENNIHNLLSPSVILHYAHSGPG